jgi:hypothetical protein
VATIPTVPNEAPGNFNTAALWNANILGGIGYLLAPVRFKGYSSTVQSVTSGTTIGALTLDTEVYDSDGGHSTTTNTSRYTVQTPGLYHVGGSVCLNASPVTATGTRTICVLLNGVVVLGSMVQAPASSVNGTTVQTATDVQCAVGDYIEIACWQNSGVTMSTQTPSNPGLATTMCLYRVSS